VGSPAPDLRVTLLAPLSSHLIHAVTRAIAQIILTIYILFNSAQLNSTLWKHYCRGRDRSGHGLRTTEDRGRVTDLEGRERVHAVRGSRGHGGGNNCRGRSRVTCRVRTSLPRCFFLQVAFPILYVVGQHRLQGTIVPSGCYVHVFMFMLPGCHASIASIASSPIHSITHRCHCVDPLLIRFPLLSFCLASRAPVPKIPGSPTPIASISQTTAYTTPRQSSPHSEPLTAGLWRRRMVDLGSPFPLSYVFTTLFT
jgi:hypothetical protein